MAGGAQLGRIEADIADDIGQDVQDFRGDVRHRVGVGNDERYRAASVTAKPVTQNRG